MNILEKYGFLEFPDDVEDISELISILKKEEVTDVFRNHINYSSASKTKKELVKSITENSQKQMRLTQFIKRNSTEAHNKLYSDPLRYAIMRHTGLLSSL